MRSVQIWFYRMIMLLNAELPKPVVVSEGKDFVELIKGISTIILNDC